MNPNLGLIAPAYRGHPDAEAWADYLAKRLSLDPAGDDLSGGYAWNCPIPPRATWRAEAEGLAAHLREVMGGECAE